MAARKIVVLLVRVQIPLATLLHFNEIEMKKH